MSGGRDRFDTFYAATHRRIVGQVYAMTGSLREAEDCVQEAYAQAWQQWDRISNDVGSPEAWVRTVAVRRALSPWRKAVTRLKGHPVGHSKGHQRERQRADAVPGMSPEHHAVIAALLKIPADQRMAIVLHHHAGLSIEEIAAETGVAPGTVETRLGSGRKALTYLTPLPAELADTSDTSDRRPRAPQFTKKAQLSRRGI